jgi:hypothetical protein
MPRTIQRLMFWIVLTGQTFNLNVSISGVTDLYSWQFDLSFDHTLLTANSINEGPFLKTGGSTNYVAGAIDNSAGTIKNTADTLTGFTGVSGSGVLAFVNFTAGSTTGISNIILSNITLLDSNFNAIVNTPQNGSVTIVAAPEPATLLLFSSTLLLGLVLRKVFS